MANNTIIKKANIVDPATTSDFGGVKLYSSTLQTVTPNVLTATSGKTYALQLNSNGQAVVNVPWTDNDTKYDLVSKSADGLCLKLPNETTTTKYFRQDGTWAEPPNDNTWITYTGTSPISVSGTTISHVTTAGNKHIPTAGAAEQYLKYSSSGTASWEYITAIQNNKNASSNTNTLKVWQGTQAQYDSTAKSSDTLYFIEGETETNKSVSINGTTTSYVASNSDSVSLYAPTSAGTSGQILVSNSGTPAWSTFYLQAPATGVLNLTNKSKTASTLGTYSTAIGYQTLQASSTGINNSGLGSQTMFSNTSGSSNTALGYQTLYSNTSGGGNTAIGAQALLYNTTTGNNVALGLLAGAYYSTGSSTNTSSTQGVYLGCNSRSATSSTTNEIVIGYNAVGLGDNSIKLGNSALTYAYLFNDCITSGCTLNIGNSSSTQTTKVFINGGTSGNATGLAIRQGSSTNETAWIRADGLARFTSLNIGSAGAAGTIGTNVIDANRKITGTSFVVGNWTMSQDASGNLEFTYA